MCFPATILLVQMTIPGKSQVVGARKSIAASPALVGTESKVAMHCSTMPCHALVGGESKTQLALTLHLKLCCEMLIADAALKLPTGAAGARLPFSHFRLITTVVRRSRALFLLRNIPCLITEAKAKQEVRCPTEHQPFCGEWAARAQH
jgi:hypothetical protein